MSNSTTKVAFILAGVPFVLAGAVHTVGNCEDECAVDGDCSWKNIDSKFNIFYKNKFESN